jgi:MFS transporter, DHA2 family, multidrug resistance protein
MGGTAARRPNATMITATVMLTSILQTLDNTIANVVLPRMQGELSATQDQMTWVLTSYIVAAAIMTPLTGWLAGRIGRKQLFIASVVGFTATSALCGMAQSLSAIVVFRFLQGISGAALMPMSQAVLFDTHPPERHGRAMAAWGQAALLGPMLGPVIGGWLTDHFSWRWIFYINLPLGLIALAGLLIYLPRSETRRSSFDFMGFTLLALTVGMLQLVLDRGSTKDWFASNEIRIEAGAGALALYLFVVHVATCREPFIRATLFRDRNFTFGNVFIFTFGIVIFGSLALVPAMLQNLMNYPVFTAGLITAPRGVGILIGMMSVSRLMPYVDSRLLIGAGLGVAAVSLWQMTGFDLQMDGGPTLWSGVVQGFGIGFSYVPTATAAFTTLAPAQRNEGTALFNLSRNIGSSVGIAVCQALLVHNHQVMHSDLAARVVPYHLEARDPELAATLASPAGRLAFDRRLNAQADMVSYLDDYQFMFYLNLLLIPMLLLMQRPGSVRTKAADAPLD